MQTNVVVPQLALSILNTASGTSSEAPVSNLVTGLSVMLIGPNQVTIDVQVNPTSLGYSSIGTIAYDGISGLKSYSFVSSMPTGSKVRFVYVGLGTGTTNVSCTMYTGNQVLPVLSNKTDSISGSLLSTKAVMSGASGEDVDVRSGAISSSSQDAARLYGDMKIQEMNPIATLGVKDPSNIDNVTTAGTVTVTNYQASKEVVVASGGIYNHISRRFCYLSQGSALLMRFSMKVDTSTAGLLRLGLCDNEAGPFFSFGNTGNAYIGYFNGNTARRAVLNLTITAAATSSGNLTVTLGSDVITVPVVSGDQVGAVAVKVINAINATGKWIAQALGAAIAIRSIVTFTDSNTYTFSGGTTGVTATVQVLMTSIPSTVTSVAQSSWTALTTGINFNQFHTYEIFWTNNSVIWSIFDTTQKRMVPVYQASIGINALPICPSLRGTDSISFEYSDLSIYESTTKFFQRIGSKSFSIGTDVVRDPNYHIATVFWNVFVRNGLTLSERLRAQLQEMDVSLSCNTDVSIFILSGYSGNDVLTLSATPSQGAYLMTTGTLGTSSSVSNVIWRGTIPANSSKSFDMSSIYIDETNVYVLGILVPTGASFSSLNGSVNWTEIH